MVMFVLVYLRLIYKNKYILLYIQKKEFKILLIIYI